jgi:FMN-dependent NADH-azoreductase
MSTTATAPRVLVVGGSPRAGDSYALALADSVVEAFVAEQPGAEVDRLDAFTEVAPFAARQTEAKMAVIGGAPVPSEDTDAWDGVVAVWERLAAADLVVIAAPIWNHALPWALKLFIDTVTQPGLAFGFDPAEGYHGLLGGRRAVVVHTSAVWSPGVAPAFGTDDASPYLRGWLEFVGIDDVREVRLHTTYPTPDLAERVERAHADARAIGRELAAATVGR